MKKKPARKKYERRKKLPSQIIAELEQELDIEKGANSQYRQQLENKISRIENNLKQRIQQIDNLNILLNNQWAELVQLRETNNNLTEVISKLGNNLRMEKHEKLLSNAQALNNTQVTNAKADEYKF